MQIRQRVGFMKEMLDDATSGRIVPAAFQRPYVWNRDDVEALWKSVIEGWPLGSVILWSPHQDIDQDRMGKARLGPVMATGHKWSRMILDGQNRLATLAWSLLPANAERPDDADLSPMERETWDPSMSLVCDYELRQILFVPTVEADIGKRFPVAALADIRVLNPIIRKLDKVALVSDAELDWIFKKETNLRESMMVVTNINGGTPAEAVEAFRNVARVGQPVSAEDLETALNWLDDYSPRPR